MEVDEDAEGTGGAAHNLHSARLLPPLQPALDGDCFNGIRHQHPLPRQ